MTVMLLARACMHRTRIHTSKVHRVLNDAERKNREAAAALERVA